MLASITPARGQAPAELPPLPMPPAGPVPPFAPAAAAPMGAPIEAGDLVEVLAEPKVEVPVVVGRSRVFELKRPVRRIVLGNPAIADVRTLDPDAPVSRLLDVFGKSFGTTTLTLWDEQDRTTSILIRVTIDAEDLEARIARIFPGADVRVTQIGPQVVLDGQVPDAKTMSEVLQVVTQALLSESVNARGALMAPMAPPVALRDDLRRASFQQDAPAPSAMDTEAPEIEAAGGDVAGGMPAAPPYPADEMTPGFVGAPSFFNPVSGGATNSAGMIVNRIHIPGPRQVLLKVKIAEINRTAIRQLGVNWQRITAGDVLNSTIGNIGTVGSQLYGIFDEGKFSLYINALRSNNLAKILAEPNLVALDGQPAHFLAGGKFPYPVPQSATIPGGGTVVTIQFQEFGAILQFIPHILDQDTIRLDVSPVFSELNFATGTAVNGTTVPGVNQRSARSVVQLREGQTLALAGLLQTRTNATTARIPGLGDIPVVGPWFSRNSIETTESELIVLVTPELVEPMEANEVPPSPGDRVWEPNDAEFFFLGRIEGRTGYPHRSTISVHDPLNIMKHFQSERRWVVGPHGPSDH
jgi:pilus assembly protein CpaC